MDKKVLSQMWTKLEGVHRLPTLPEVYMKVGKAINDPAISAQKLAKIILMDQGLTASILRFVNSAYFGFRQQVNSISQAIMLLGFSAIHDFVLSVSLMEIFPIDDKEQGSFRGRGYWEHSIAVAVASRLIADELEYPNRETVFIGGMIHDIGRVVLKLVEPKRFLNAVNRSLQEQTFLLDGEVMEFGFTHAEVGSLIAGMWHFPDIFAGIIAYHHMPSKVLNPDMSKPVTIIHLADCLTRALEYGFSGESLVPPIDTAACEAAGITTEMIPKILTRLQEEFAPARDSIMVIAEEGKH